MRKKIFLISILVFSFNLLNTLAQMPSEPKKISGGVLNAKAIKLVKPSYPAAALAVRASGAVIVQVLVDEQGNVISASAVSGHPLLRQACEQAAFAAKFNPTILEGQPVRVSGVIVYNFVATMSFIQIGYELTLAENSASLKEAFPANDIVGSLPKDWTEEKAVVWKIGSNFVEKSSEEKIPQTEEKKITQASSQTNKSAPPREGIATRIGSGNTIGYGDAIGSGIATSISTDKISTEFDNLNKAETIQKLRAKIENRLSSDEKNSGISNLAAFSERFLLR
jgi:TonB family protein